MVLFVPLEALAKPLGFRNRLKPELRTGYGFFGGVVANPLDIV